MASRPAFYTLQQGSELSGLSEDMLWHTCQRMGLDPDAVPDPLVQEIRWHLSTIVDCIVQRDCHPVPPMGRQQRGRAMA